MILRSIQRTLIVYFLVLLTGALGAVCWASYRTAAESLRARQEDSARLIRAQCEGSCDIARTALDKRLLRQAQTLAGMARWHVVHFEGLYMLGLVGSAAMPEGYLHARLWLAQGLPAQPPGDNYIMRQVLKAQPKIAHVDSADDIVAVGDANHSQEYFQMYSGSGHTVQRSDTLDGHFFTLDEEFRQKADLFTESFDDVELKPGVKVRRVTLKTQVLPGGSFVGVPMPWPWRGVPYPWRISVTPKGGGKNASRPVSSGLRPGVEPVFIQYATDMHQLEAKILEYHRASDRQLARLESSIDGELRQLGGAMLSVALFTTLALWLGGYSVIRIGLAPLANLSDAVSRVSPQNFKLPLKSGQLPDELQPIAGRLQQTLQELSKAFAREKQAAADISHELRTPLAALMTTVEVALRKTRSPEEYKEILEDCRASGQHMYQLVERLLTLARLDAGAVQYNPCEVDAVEVALQCSDIIRPLAKARGLDLRLHLPDPVLLHTDPNKLSEVLVNLLHNAVEYNKPGGSIELSIEAVAGRVRIEVRDTGIGIKPEALPRIFERFYRADPSRHADTPHAGLGLAIVKSYIDLMHGSIRVNSSEAGTAFIVELPAAASNPRLSVASGKQA
jgi:heavy metal sensor kinase